MRLRRTPQDRRLLPSCFASPSPRLLLRHHRRTAATFALGALSALVPLSSGAQQALGSAAADAARALQFLAGRNAPASGSRGAAAAFILANRPGNSMSPLAGGTASLNTAWQPLGPVTVTSPLYGALTGRVTALALDPNDTTGNTLYVGTTGGGVWRSGNAAGALASVTFTPLTDRLPIFNAGTGGTSLASLSIGSLAVQPTPNPVLLAGTGDPNSATDSYYGSGILRSTDGGNTWTLAGGSRDGANGNHSFAGLSVAALAFSSATPTLAVAALSTALEGTTVQAADTSATRGLVYSTDAGVTWREATLYDGGSVMQQPLPSQTGNAATAVVWDPVRGRFYAAIRYHGFYESADGATWTRLPQQPGTGLTLTACPTATSTACPLYRAALAVQSVTGDLFVLSVSAGNADNGLWQDRCLALPAGGCTAAEPAFTRIDNGVLDSTTGGGTLAQGTYNLALLAAPAKDPSTGTNTATMLFAGTEDLYRCAVSAASPVCTLRNTTNAANGCNAPAGVAPAQHAVAALTLNGTPALWLGNDGGLWRSLDGVAETGPICAAADKAHFDNLNAALGTGGSLAEVAGFASHPTDSDTLLAGLGALGSAGTGAATQLTPWPQLSAGEGGQPLIDPANPLNRFVTIGAGINLKLCTHGASCTAADFTPPATLGSGQVAGDTALLHAPLLLDPANPDALLLGTCRFWRGPVAMPTGWRSGNALSLPQGSYEPCGASARLFRSIAAGGPTATSTDTAHSGSTVLYAGGAGVTGGGTAALGGHVFLLRDAGLASPTTPLIDLAASTVTNDAAGFNPYGFDITSVTADAHDPTGATVYATVGGLGTGAVPPHVYRSVDFGAHWTNISANLPDAPANALVVDPNDANTVYIALDTGVYATTAVTTCTAANCWSPFGTGLPNSPVVAMAAAPDLLTGDGRRGLLRVGTYGRGLWQQPLLNAVSLLQPGFALAPTQLSFAAQQVSTRSAAQTITLTSNGNAPVTISSVTLSNTDFAETDTCSGQTLAVNATCTLSVVFTPAAQGARTATLTVFANTAGGQATVALSGTGLAPPDVVLTPTALTFPATIVNQTGAPQIVNIANTGGATATLGTPVLTGDFTLAANTCGATLLSQTACALSIAFTPTAGGPRSGTLTLTGSAGTQTATLTGIGNAPATDTLSASALSFAQTTVGSTSAAQSLTITNAGDVALTLLNSTISGPFTVSSSCGTSLAAKSTCALQIAFVPVTAGTATGSLTVTDQFRSQAVALSGSGVAPPGVSLTPASLNFGTAAVGLSAPAQTVTLSNNGGTTLQLSKAAVSGDFTIAASTCGSAVAAGASCTYTLVFTPVAGGVRTGHADAH